jgi:hypothetical protein
MGLVRHFSGFFLHYYDWRDAGVNGQARGLWDGDRNNFAPRIGLACQLHRRTVVRAGYGIFFDVLGIDRYNVNQGGYSQSGDALGCGNAIFFGDLQDIPLPVSQRKAERWFNVDAGFERGSSRALGSTIRTLPSHFNNVRADGINNFDLSMFKNYRVKERYTLQFRLESYNTLNHVQMGPPNTTPTATAFGTINAERTRPAPAHHGLEAHFLIWLG